MCQSIKTLFEFQTFKRDLLLFYWSNSIYSLTSDRQVLKRGATVSQTCSNKNDIADRTINCQSNLDCRVLYKKKLIIAKKSQQEK